MAEQTAIANKARRDADEQRKKAEADFKSGSNIYMPRYERDDYM